jgi:hypothetical protein
MGDEIGAENTEAAHLPVQVAASGSQFRYLAG